MRTRFALALPLCFFAATASPGASAQSGPAASAAITGTATETILHSFGGVKWDGQMPLAIMRASDGSFYGATGQGGPFIHGTVFRLTVDSTTGGVTSYRNVHSFNDTATDGIVPGAGVIQGADGAFYGTTISGGTAGEYGQGVIYRLELDSTTGEVTSYKILYSLKSDGSQGANTIAPLVQGSDGRFYGMTYAGGEYGLGTIYRFALASSRLKAIDFEVLHSFGFSPRDGEAPAAGLIQGSDGRFYGTTTQGGDHGYGTVFRFSINASTGAIEDYEIVHSFNNNGKDGIWPSAALLQAKDGNFYGTTPNGGEYGQCSSCFDGYGTVFRLSFDSATGAITGYQVLHSFGQTSSDGMQPMAALIQATDGNLYGVTSAGGPQPGYGTFFKLTLGGKGATESVLYAFGTNGTGDGLGPVWLVQGSDGDFYGVTSVGGAYEWGTVFRIVP